MENLLEILKIIAREDGIILILIGLLFIDKCKAWVDLVEDAYRRWRKLDKKEANKNLEDYTTKIRKIHEILEIYRHSTNAARAAYYVFHNGGKDIRGIPFLKYSCVNESVALGTRPRLKLDKDLHIADITCWTKILITGGITIGDTIDLIEGGKKDILKEFDVTKYALSPIYDDSLLCGFVVFEWRLEKYFPDEIEFIKENVLQCSKMLELNSVKDINQFLSY